MGTYPADVMNPAPEIPDMYWALSASVQTYVWCKLVELGIDLVGISEFIDYPGMIPGVSLLDWETGAPNARYHALALLLRHFAEGDALAATTTGVFPDPRIHAQAFVTASGRRKLLLVNKTAAPVAVTVPDVGGGADFEQVGADGYRTTLADDTAVLEAFATSVVSY
ncbi:hypothetical protein ACFYV7_35865 [Nocardia suismassiliense]|uniref:D-apionate lactonase C-terminal domain-containing protein n=1 Tax=Nocardia suismassiliense TaxID=2077092 RepID=A0ABW6R3Y4_9NOCA